jgi:GLPGLI family protein
MKKLFFSLLLIFTLFTVSAQLTQGYVKFDIVLSSDSPETQIQLAMWEGSCFEVYFKNELTRTEMSMGSMVKVSNITNASIENALMLITGAMGNIAVKLTKDDMEKSKNENGNVIITLSDETKEILGFMCHKAISTDEEGNESIIWYSKEIKVNKIGQNYLNNEVPGFPLEFEVNRANLKMRMTSTEFNKKLDKSKSQDVFSLEVPEGFKEMLLEELSGM